MPRHTVYSIPLDTSFFTPLQLQPIAVARLGFNAGVRWMKEHLFSHRSLIWDHGVGLVLWAWELEYGGPLTFRAADEADVDVSCRVRGRGSQLECEVTFSGPTSVAAVMRAVFLPLTLSGDTALSGRPRSLPGAVLAGFLDDEVDSTPYRSKASSVHGDVQRDGRHLASSEEAFRIHRHHCEVADQWFWAEVAGFAAASREELVVQYAPEHAAVRPGLAEPVARIDVSYAQAYQFRDLATVSTSAYEWRDRLVFVHEFGLSDDEGGGVHALAVEQF